MRHPPASCAGREQSWSPTQSRGHLLAYFRAASPASPTVTAAELGGTTWLSWLVAIDRATQHEFVQSLFKMIQTSGHQHTLQQWIPLRPCSGYSHIWKGSGYAVIFLLWYPNCGMASPTDYIPWGLPYTILSFLLYMDAITYCHYVIWMTVLNEWSWGQQRGGNAI